MRLAIIPLVLCFASLVACGSVDGSHPTGGESVVATGLPPTRALAANDSVVVAVTWAGNGQAATLWRIDSDEAVPIELSQSAGGLESWNSTALLAVDDTNVFWAWPGESVLRRVALSGGTAE